MGTVRRIGDYLRDHYRKSKADRNSPGLRALHFGTFG
jgi:hypothetical protein